MNTRCKAILICGIITLLATSIISSLCISDWEGVTKWAFTAILWSEIVLFGGILFVERISQRTEQIITRVLLYTIISLYSVLNLLVSAIYIASFKDGSTSFTIIQVAMFAVATISFVISIVASKAVQQSNEHTMATVENTEQMVERLKKLAVCPACEKYASTLRTLSDDLRFTDISKVVAEDADISILISGIEVEIDSIDDSSDDKIKSALVRLKTLIAQRQISLSAANKGKI